MSLEKSLSQHFSSILECVDARNDYRYMGLVVAAVVVGVYDAHGALLHVFNLLLWNLPLCVFFFV